MNLDGEELFVIIRTGCTWDIEGGKKNIINLGDDYGLDFDSNIGYPAFVELVKLKTGMLSQFGITLYYQHPKQQHIIKMVDGSDLTRLKRVIKTVEADETTVCIYLFEVKGDVKPLQCVPPSNNNVTGCKRKRDNVKKPKEESEGCNDDVKVEETDKLPSACDVPLLKAKVDEEQFIYTENDMSDGEKDTSEGVHNEGYHYDPFFGMPNVPPCDVSGPKITHLYRHKLSIFESIKIHQIFDTKEELIQTLSVHAINNRREYIPLKSSKTLYVGKCVDETCQWRVYASAIKNTKFFQIRTLNNTHTCSSTRLNPNHRQAKRKVLAILVAELMSADPTRVFKGKEIITLINLKYKIQVNYPQAFRAKGLAMKLVRGSHEESFGKLPAYCHNLKIHNPGTFTFIKTDEEDRFQFIFIAIGASIRSFQTSCRRVLVVDAAHLKGEYKGMMLLAVAMDGNNQIVPIAFAICRSESNENWTLFFDKLNEAIGDLGRMSFISDRNQGLAAGIATVYPQAYHGICGHHLHANVVHACGKSDQVGKLFWKASKAYTVPLYNKFINALKSHHKKSWDYVNRVDPKKWARAHFEGRRYNLMTSNSAESVNALTRQARRMPIMMLMDFYRKIVQTWYFQRRNIGADFKTTLTKWADEKVAKRKEKINNWTVSPISNEVFQVIDNARGGQVNFQTRKCTCRKWQLSGLPCAHVIAVLTCQGYHDCAIFAETYFTTNTHRRTYQELIHPLPHPDDWEIPDDLMQVKVPVMEARQPGRPKNNDRVPSQGESPVVKRCTRCLNIGHNRENCPALVPKYRDGPSGHTPSVQWVPCSQPESFDVFPTVRLG